jgi:hypothetical protein
MVTGVSSGFETPVSFAYNPGANPPCAANGRPDASLLGGGFTKGKREGGRGTSMSKPIDISICTLPDYNQILDELSEF